MDLCVSRVKRLAVLAMVPIRLAQAVKLAIIITMEIVLQFVRTLILLIMQLGLAYPAKHPA
jgi:hypothetical protein